MRSNPRVCYTSCVAGASEGTLRKQVGQWLTPAIFILVLWAPLGLEPTAHRLAAIFAAVAIAWVTEVVPIAMTALLIGPLLVACGVTDPKTAFAPYADPLIFLFIGGFFIAQAMMRHGLDRRIAMSMTQRKWVGDSPVRVRLVMMAAAFVLSMWISNTAACAILLPILLGTLGKEHDGDRAGGSLTIAYACSAGGMATLVGTPPNALAARFLGEAGHPIGFGQWMGVGVPVSIAIVITVAIAMHFMAPPETIAASNTSKEQRRWSRGEKVTALAFGLAFLGWTLPSALKAIGLPLGTELSAALPSGGVAMLASSVLFIFDDDTDEKQSVLPWSDAARIDWGLVFLFGGGLALGKQMVDTGLAAEMSRWFIDATGVHTLWGFTAALALFTVFFTEVCSNTASANMLVPLAIAGALELDVSVLPPVLAVALTASCAFMLPIATGPNAIAYGSGEIRLPAMMRHGLVLNCACVVVILGVLRLLSAVYGW